MSRQSILKSTIRALLASVLSYGVFSSPFSKAQESMTIPDVLRFCLDPSAPQPVYVPNDASKVRALRVTVTFIVNREGRVESPLVLESSSDSDAQFVLNLVRRWRFRPALCNGTPITAELRARFLGPRKTLPHPVSHYPLYPRSHDTLRKLNVMARTSLPDPLLPIAQPDPELRFPL